MADLRSGQNAQEVTLLGLGSGAPVGVAGAPLVVRSDDSHGLVANPHVADSVYKARARQTDTARLASTGRISLTLSGNIRMILINPVNLDNGTANTTSVRIERLEAYATTNGFASLLFNVTGNIPTTPRRPKVNPRSLTSTTGSVAGQPVIVASDSNALAFTGGVDTGVVLPLQTDQVIGLDAPFTVAPGQNVALQANYAKGVDAVFTVYWANIT